MFRKSSACQEMTLRSWDTLHCPLANEFGNPIIALLDRHTGREKGTDSRIDRQTDRQRGIQTWRHTVRWVVRQTETGRHEDRQTDKVK